MFRFFITLDEWLFRPALEVLAAIFKLLGG